MTRISTLIVLAFLPFFAHSQCSVTVSSTNVSCYTASNGIMTANPSGTGPFTYLWTPGGQTTQTVYGVQVGTYTVTVTDANLCVSTATVTITQPGFYYSTLMSSTDASCTCNGEAVVQAGGGTPPYSYSWAPAGGNGATASGLCPGGYTCTITDNNGCITAQGTTINQTPAMSIVPTQSNATCFGSCNGTAAVSVSGGAPGYSYSWSPSGGPGASSSGLCAGGYVCTVSDVHGCTASNGFNIGQPSALAVSESHTTLSCANICDGTATAIVSGGTPGYTYSWSPTGGNAATATGLCAGVYSCSVFDAMGCSNSFSVVITQPSQMISTHVTTDVYCFGTCTGSATVAANGGNPPYTYVWSPTAGTSPTETGLCAGPYTCIITDASGCTSTETMLITQPPQLSVSVATQPASCSNCCDGTGSASATGGTSVYSYQWFPTGGPFPTTSNLCPGTYTCCVTDANGCFSCDTATVNFITGISDQSLPETLSVFPNPANESIKINQTFNAPTSALITITNVLGEVVYNNFQTAKSQLNLNIDLSAFENGLYIVTVESANSTSVQRFMKQ